MSIVHMIYLGCPGVLPPKSFGNLTLNFVVWDVFGHISLNNCLIFEIQKVNGSWEFSTSICVEARGTRSCIRVHCSGVLEHYEWGYCPTQHNTNMIKCSHDCSKQQKPTSEKSTAIHQGTWNRIFWKGKAQEAAKQQHMTAKSWSNENYLLESWSITMQSHN